MIRILLVDDHRMFRTGLRKLFDHTPGMEVVGEADNGRDALVLVGNLVPEIVIMDLSMPDMNGMEATRRIKAIHPSVKIIGLSMYSDRQSVLGMLKMGASAYLRKDCDFDELVKAVYDVAEGRTYLTPAVNDRTVREYLDKDDLRDTGD